MKKMLTISTALATLFALSGAVTPFLGALFIVAGTAGYMAKKEQNEDNEIYKSILLGLVAGSLPYNKFFGLIATLGSKLTAIPAVKAATSSLYKMSAPYIFIASIKAPSGLLGGLSLAGTFATALVSVSSAAFVLDQINEKLKNNENYYAPFDLVAENIEGFIKGSFHNVTEWAEKIASSYYYQQTDLRQAPSDVPPIPMNDTHVTVDPGNSVSSAASLNFRNSVDEKKEHPVGENIDHGNDKRKTISPSS